MEPRLDVRTAEMKIHGDRAQPYPLAPATASFPVVAGLRFSDRKPTFGSVRAPQLGIAIPNDWCPFIRGISQHFPLPPLLYTTLH
jgi:hypothetical protein